MGQLFRAWIDLWNEHDFTCCTMTGLECGTENIKRDIEQEEEDGGPESLGKEDGGSQVTGEA